MRTFGRLLPTSVMLLVLSCGGDDPPDMPPPAPLGSLVVKWRIQSADGTPKTCADVGVETMEVAIGGPGKVVPCTDGMTSFADLIANSRYPVVVRAQFQGATRATATANATIEANKEAIAEVIFVLENVISGEGQARIRWTIDGMSPSSRCAAVLGSRVRVLSLPGSLEDIDEMAPCAAGELIISSLTAGAYALALRLENAAGELIVSASMQPFEVQPGLLAEPPAAAFSTGMLDPTRIVAQWTINSSAAADACDVINAGRVTVFATSPPPARITTSSTVDCDVGTAILEDTLDRGSYTVRFELVYDVVIQTSTTVPVALQRGETSTVAIDFHVE